MLRDLPIQGRRLQISVVSTRPGLYNLELDKQVEERRRDELNRLVGERREPVDECEGLAAVALETGFVDFEESQIGPGNEPSELNQDPWRGVADEAHDVADSDIEHGHVFDSELDGAAEDLHLMLRNELRECDQEGGLQCLQSMELNAPDEHLFAKDAKQ